MSLVESFDAVQVGKMYRIIISTEGPVTLNFKIVKKSKYLFDENLNSKLEEAIDDIEIEATDTIPIIIKVNGKRVNSYIVKSDEDDIYIYIPPERYYDGYNIYGLHQFYGPLKTDDTESSSSSSSSSLTSLSSSSNGGSKGKGAGKMKKSKKRSSKKAKKAKKSKKTKRSKRHS